MLQSTYPAPLTPAALPRRIMTAVAVATLGLVVVGLVARNDSWIYSRIGWLDPWTYVGFGYSYDKPAFDADDYKLARLPWILVEFYTRRVFAPVAAQYALQLGLLFLEGIFFFLAIRRLLGWAPALVGAAFLVTIAFAHGAGGADYNTTLSGPLYALAFFALTAAAASERGLPPLLFGISFGLLLHTNFLYLNLAPALIIQFAAIRRQAAKLFWSRGTVRFVLYSMLGVLVATVGLAIVNRTYGRDWLFFANLFNFATDFLLGIRSQDPWRESWASRWYDSQFYPGLLAAAFVVSVALLFAASMNADTWTKRLPVINLCAQYFCLILLWTFWQTMGQTALQPYYYAYPLWIPLAGLVSATIAWSLREPAGAPGMTIVHRIALAAVTVVAFVAPYSVFEALNWPLRHWSANPFSRTVILYLAVAAVGLLLASLRARVGVFVVVLLLGAANALSNDNSANYRPARCVDARDAQIAAIAAQHWIASFDPDFSRPIFVWRNPDNGDAVSMSSCSLVPARFFGDSLSYSGWRFLDDARPFGAIKDISQERLRSLIPHDPIVVLVTEDAGAAEQIRSRFAELNMHFGPTESVVIYQGAVKVPLFVLR
jgi:hypothetical protein